MGEKVAITINSVIKEYQKGTTLLEISKEVQNDFEYDIILAKVDHKLRELTYHVDHDCNVEFITTNNSDGHKTYMRGMTLLMLKAMYSVVGSENLKKVCVEYAIGTGYYCDVDVERPLDETTLDAVQKEMQRLVDADLPFEKIAMSTDSAIDLFHQYGMYDKEKLFKYRRVSTANIYSLDGFKDYYYGYMPATTGVLKYFKLFLYDEGFIMQLPKRITPKTMDIYVPSHKLFSTMKESNKWGQKMEIGTVGSLNDAICQGGASDMILVQEAFQEKKIAQIAEQICSAKDKKFVMIAGPSSSGKTTFSHRLSIQLRTFGLKPHPIAIDNYFVNREQTPVDEDGNYNYECLEAIDVEQFNKDMVDLLDGKTVELPTFNFKAGAREYKGDYRTLGPDDILVIEGIHGLNDKMSYALPKESKFRIYISALTQLNVDEHNRIPTTDGRLLRRIVRDARTRGTSAAETIAMWPSVRKGEEQNIFPFQEQADVMFNSALIHELAILKQYAEPLLFGIPKDAPEFIEANRLLKFLDYFMAITSDEVPKNSILREFIGGSCFNV